MYTCLRCGEDIPLMMAGGGGLCVKCCISEGGYGLWEGCKESIEVAIAKSCMLPSSLVNSAPSNYFDPGPPIGETIDRMFREAALENLGPDLPLPTDVSSCFKGSNNPIDVRT